ncbi:hypothetical protein BLNAU_20615 [Blattamonas nauphoetae]|uniref:Uncharacterized protein n=1 Tax=Blattamonas nauphoetae TaxID=2049346 RepID=A0ABQ9WYD4_9EUKA|nr:hypothetical protein BLNAU_20615 [Blattamonas nauphoetae]
MRIALVALQLTRCWCARLAADHSGTILVVDDTSFNFTSQLEYDVLISSSSAGMATVFRTQPPDVVSDMKHGSSVCSVSVQYISTTIQSETKEIEEKSEKNVLSDFIIDFAGNGHDREKKQSVGRRAVGPTAAHA